jgi:hypothetical protein
MAKLGSATGGHEIGGRLEGLIGASSLQFNSPKRQSIMAWGRSVSVGTRSLEHTNGNEELVLEV